MDLLKVTFATLSINKFGMSTLLKDAEIKWFICRLISRATAQSIQGLMLILVPIIKVQ